MGETRARGEKKKGTYAERLERLVQALFHAVVECAPQLGSDEYLFAGDARVFDTLADFIFVLANVSLPRTALIAAAIAAGAVSCKSYRSLA
jgi:hypothetical protein